MAGQKPKCFIMLAGPNIYIYIYINIFSELFFTLNFLETKFLFTLLWNLMLIFVQFNFNFSHVSDIVQTDYLFTIDIFDIDHLQYTYLLMCSILLIMIIFTHNNNIFFTLCRVLKCLLCGPGKCLLNFICITTSIPP